MKLFEKVANVVTCQHAIHNLLLSETDTLSVIRRVRALWSVLVSHAYAVDYRLAARSEETRKWREKEEEGEGKGGRATTLPWRIPHNCSLFLNLLWPTPRLFLLSSLQLSSSFSYFLALLDLLKTRKKFFFEFSHCRSRVIGLIILLFFQRTHLEKCEWVTPLSTCCG